MATRSSYENLSYSRRWPLILLAVAALLIFAAFQLPGGVDRMWADCGRSNWDISVADKNAIEKAADLDNCDVVRNGDAAAHVQQTLGEPWYRGDQVWEYPLGQVDGFKDCTVAVLFSPDRRVTSLDVRGCGW